LFFGLRLVSKEFEHPTQNRAALWWILSSNKSAPANRKSGFYSNCDPNKQEVGFIFALKRLRILKSFQIFKSVKFKSQKPVTVDAL